MNFLSLLVCSGRHIQKCLIFINPLIRCQITKKLAKSFSFEGCAVFLEPTFSFLPINFRPPCKKTIVTDNGMGPMMGLSSFWYYPFHDDYGKIIVDIEKRVFVFNLKKASLVFKSLPKIFKKILPYL